MKKLIFTIAVLGLIALIGCANVKVNYPIPLKSAAEFIVITSNGSYDDTLYINTAEIFTDLEEELNKAGLSLSDLQGINLEGAAYTMTQTSDSTAIVEGTVDIQYINTPYTEVMTVKPLVFLDILNQPQVDVLNADGVAILNMALQDLINTPGINRQIGVKSNGSLTTGGGDIVFTMLVEFTITAIVQKEVSKLSPLG
jgi:hypothetical protein